MLQSPANMDNVTLIRLISGSLALFVFFAIVVATVVPYWRIFSRLGFSGWLAILMAIPLVNLAVLYYVAYSRWNLKPEPSQPPASTSLSS
jgi:hypothetical protein